MSKLKTSISMYNWVFKMTGALLLIALAIWLWIDQPEKLMEAFVGLLIGGYALIRLVPFIKTQRSDLIKTVNIIEIVLNVLVAAMFIGNALVAEEALGDTFKWLFGGVLILRGMVHFYGVSDGNEKGDHPTYFFHIATIIIGTLIITRGYQATDLIILIIILAIGSAGYLTYSAYGGYHMYRKHKQLAAESKKQPEKEIPADIPKKEDPPRDQPVQ